MTRLLTLEVRNERDVVLARQRTRQIAGLLGFDAQDQVRLATAVSEIVRNAFQYAGGGRVGFSVEARTLQITVRDEGPGIADLSAVLEGRHRSSNGSMGVGLAGSRRLVDASDVESVPGQGTVVRLRKALPQQAPDPAPPVLARLCEEMIHSSPDDPLVEMQRQNRELLRALEDLRDREVQLAQVNRELEETNRGVVALYAELEEKADSLKRVSDLKSRFLSNMSHEFRTPLNSIISLTQFLQDRSDGPLTEEQDKQIGFIRRAAQGLSELVNDLLDLAKVEAGKVVVRPETFRASELFSTLRGMMRPLLTGDSVALVFEEPARIVELHTDEAKVGQILRNFISNALKFTEQGEVRVSAAAGPGDTVVFAVADTGIGIAQQDQAAIFEEFGQVESAVQKRVKGTGLGLPLSRKLAELLGGTVSVRSEPGSGSTFYLTVPRIYAASAEAGAAGLAIARKVDPARTPILVVEDDPTAGLLYERYLTGSGFQVLGVRTCAEARELLREVRPAAVVLDILLDAESGWSLLSELKSNESTRTIPVLVVTVVDDRQRAVQMGAQGFALKPVEREWLLQTLKGLARLSPAEVVLLIDDDEISRYLLRGLLEGTGYAIAEAADAAEGLRQAREERPRAIFLDLVLPDLTGFEVLDQLKADPATRDIPVIVNTSKSLSEEERSRLAVGAVAILSKGQVPSREAGARLIQDTLQKAGVRVPAQRGYG